MKIKLWQRILIMLLLVFVIIPSNVLPQKITYAASLDSWLQSIEDITPNKKKFYHFKYKDESTTYNAYFMQIKLPNQATTYPRIAYKYSTSGSISFVYQELGTDGKINESPVKLNLEAVLDESTTPQKRRSILKRQAANNFNTSDDKFGYLLEVAGNITAYEGKKIVFTAQIGEGDSLQKEEITVLPTGWSESTYFTVEDQNSDKAWWEVVIAWISDALNEVKNLIEGLINDVLLALADGILAAICAAVGEPVTMDKVIFGNVGKLSINFWDHSDAGTNSVKAVLSDVVDDWYNVFFMIAIIVYLAALLFTGLKIVLASTGDSKAKYKDTLQAWLSGVMILFLFPYVMKYTVTLNNALIQMINTDFSVTEVEETPEVSEGKLDSLSGAFGEADFIDSFRGTTDPNADPKKDIMVYVRKLAGDLGKLSLTFVYFVLLGELIVIIIVYYKRVFMMAFLITVFPIIAIFYIIEKMGSGNSRALSSWMKEYMVLVFTQAFHAAVYVVVVNAGVQSYIESDNWLFMLMCVIFLFQGEKILRSIFGMKSSANTIGDLATAGMAAYGLAKSVPGVFKRDKSNPADAQEDKQIEEAKKKSKPLADGSGTSVPGSAKKAAEESGESGGGGGGDSTDEEPKTPQDVTNDPNANFSKASSAVIAKALGNRKKGRGKGIIGKVGNGVLNVAGGAVGATLGVAAGLAQGDLGKAATYAVAGKEMGKAVMAPGRAVVRGVSNAYHGRKLKRKIMKGEMDKDFKKLGFDLSSMDSEKQAIFREALANLAQTTTTGGKAKGELRMINTMSKMDKKQK